MAPDMASPYRRYNEDTDLDLLQERTRDWIEHILEESLPSETSLGELLADGEILRRVGQLVSILHSNVSGATPISTSGVPRVHSRSQTWGTKVHWDAIANVDSFLKVCREVGLTDVDLCVPPDVVEKRDLRSVCRCIRTLAVRLSSTKAVAKEFEPPALVSGAAAARNSLHDCSAGEGRVESVVRRLDAGGPLEYPEIRCQPSDEGFDSDEYEFDHEHEVFQERGEDEEGSTSSMDRVYIEGHEFLSSNPSTDQSQQGMELLGGQLSTRSIPEAIQENGGGAHSEAAHSRRGALESGATVAEEGPIVESRALLGSSGICRKTEDKAGNENGGESAKGPQRGGSEVTELQEDVFWDTTALADGMPRPARKIATKVRSGGTRGRKRVGEPMGDGHVAGPSTPVKKIGSGTSSTILSYQVDTSSNAVGGSRTTKSQRSGGAVSRTRRHVNKEGGGSSTGEGEGRSGRHPGRGKRGKGSLVKSVPGWRQKLEKLPMGAVIGGAVAATGALGAILFFFLKPRPKVTRQPPREYHVQKGDCLIQIAQKVGKNDWVEIYEQNPDIEDPNLIRAEAVLRV